MLRTGWTWAIRRPPEWRAAGGRSRAISLHFRTDAFSQHELHLADGRCISVILLLAVAAYPRRRTRWRLPTKPWPVRSPDPPTDTPTRRSNYSSIAVGSAMPSAPTRTYAGSMTGSIWAISTTHRPGPSWHGSGR